MFAVSHLLTNALWRGAPGCGNPDGGTGICTAGTFFIAPGSNMHCISYPLSHLYSRGQNTPFPDKKEDVIMVAAAGGPIKVINDTMPCID
jgi:hypothetical protein